MQISQREARRLRRRVEELERAERVRQSQWSRDYPGGINFCTVTLPDIEAAKVRAAQLLEHAIVAKADGTTLRLYALRQGDE